MSAPRGRRRPALGLPVLGLATVLGLASLAVLALLLAACGGGDGDGVAPTVEAEQPAEQTQRPAEAADAAAQAGAGDPAEQAEEEEEAPPDPAPPQRVAAIIEVLVDDLPPGFDAIPFYADIPGLLRESPDGNLASIGLRAAVPGLSAGQGFANNESGELIFVVTIMMESAEAAEAAVDYIGTRQPLQVMQLVEPSDTLFASDRKPDPLLGSSAVRYALRYGVEEAGRRTRDVATELVIFGQGGSLVFLQRSVNVTGATLETAGQETDVDLLALGQSVAERITEAILAGASPNDDA